MSDTNPSSGAHDGEPSKRTGASLVSPASVDTYLPTDPVLTSGSKWNGIVAQVHEDFVFPQRRSVPSLASHGIYLHLKNSTSLERWLEGRRVAEDVGVGDMTIVPAQRETEWRWSDPIRILHLHIQPSLLRHAAERSAGIDPDRLELIPRFGASDPLVKHIGQALLNELRAGPSDGQLYASQAAEMLAVHLLQKHGSMESNVNTYTGGIPSARLQRVKDFVEAHLSDDIRLDDLAQEAELSKYHFSRQFKKSVGLSPSQYVIKRRIKKGKELLEETDWLVARVSLEVGYESQSRFTTQFKRRVGTTPAAYRAAQS
jgi:AraC family transcriptional regulator